MIGQSVLKDALGVNGQVKCDCGHVEFEVGVGINPENGNNFIRLLQCNRCGKQMPATHRSDAQLAPSMMFPGRVLDAFGTRVRGETE